MAACQLHGRWPGEVLVTWFPQAHVSWVSCGRCGMKSNSAGKTEFRGRISRRLKSLHKAPFPPSLDADREARAKHFRQNPARRFCWPCYTFSATFIIERPTNDEPPRTN